MPTSVALPLSVPVDGLSTMPAGKLPAITLQVNGLTPPVPARVSVYALLTVATGSVVVPTATCGTIVIRPATPTESKPLSEIVAVKAGASATAGVPVMEQLLLSVRPAGSAPLVTAHEYGGRPPAGVHDPEYGT